MKSDTIWQCYGTFTKISAQKITFPYSTPNSVCSKWAQQFNRSAFNGCKLEMYRTSWCHFGERSSESISRIPSSDGPGFTCGYAILERQMAVQRTVEIFGLLAVADMVAFSINYSPIWQQILTVFGDILCFRIIQRSWVAWCMLVKIEETHGVSTFLPSSHEKASKSQRWKLYPPVDGGFPVHRESLFNRNSSPVIASLADSQSQSNQARFVASSIRSYGLGLRFGVEWYRAEPWMGRMWMAVIGEPG